MTAEDRARLDWLTTRGYRMGSYRGAWAVLDERGREFGPWRNSYRAAIDAGRSRAP